ncbi:MAG TPA: M1 family peptidase, partial [Candidatus Binatia bacterium]|nr:M1 family peptidase [Candidatus Binatia bacterium]
MTLLKMTLLKQCVWMILAFLPLLAGAQRLPYGLSAKHYGLSFTPDLQKATFSGDEMLDVEVNKTSSEFTLSSVDLEFQEATITQDNKTQVAKWTFAADKEQVTLAVADPLEPGPEIIHIKYTGILNDKLRGFYLAKTKQRNYATTQFESTDARRAFPSLDEPAYKATFDITLIVNKGDTAISNSAIAS